jgi:hypothetical protein
VALSEHNLVGFVSEERSASTTNPSTLAPPHLNSLENRKADNHACKVIIHDE